MKRAFMFPGQGSQAVGMGAALAKAFPAAREVFEEVDEALKQNLSSVIFDGPDDELTLTANTQPALLAVSMATLRVLQAEGGLVLDRACAMVAGHSMGEYAALSAADSFSLADASRLLKTRGEAMQRAVPVGDGAMAAILGLDLEAVTEIAAAAAAADVCAAANDNAPGQVVISGSSAAVERALEQASGAGAKRSIMLPVSAPFHCALMAPAAEAMEEALEEVAMEVPGVPLIANVTARPVTDPAEIKNLLVRQVTAPVRWRETVLYMAEQEVETLVEIGAGRVLGGLARRIDRSLQTVAVSSPEAVEAFLKTI